MDEKIRHRQGLFALREKTLGQILDHREDSVQDAIIEEQYARLVETVRDYNPAADFVHIESAYHFAKRCHEAPF